MAAIKAAHIRRFDEDLPRTETLMAVAMIGYRIALRDGEAGTPKTLPTPAAGASPTEGNTGAVAAAAPIGGGA
jgi:hypothetical protein